MTEKQKNHDESTANPNNDGAISDADYEMFKNWEQDTEASAAARRTVEITEPSDSHSSEHIEVHTESTEKSSKKRKHSLAGAGIAIAGTVAAASVVTGGVSGIIDATTPTFSEETTDYTVQPGDGMYDVAEQIGGVESVDIRDAVEHINEIPGNVAALQDGLQPGEQIIIPESVVGHETDADK